MNLWKNVAGMAMMSLALCAGLRATAQDTLRFTDPQIASVAVTANQIDVDYGKIALRKSGNAQIRGFAQTMVTDHSGVIRQAVALAKKLKVVPETNTLTRQLEAGAATTEKKLNAARGAAFDRAYIDNEVAYHEAVISAVNNVLIPQAKNAELKALLVKVAPVLKEHLDHAKMVQAALDK